MTNSPVDYRLPPPPAAGAPKRPLVNQRDFERLVEPLQELILKYPGAALASAFLAGVALAWWIKRR